MARRNELRCVECGRVLFWDEDDPCVEFTATVRFNERGAMSASDAREGLCGECVRKRDKAALRVVT